MYCGHQTQSVVWGFRAVMHETNWRLYFWVNLSQICYVFLIQFLMFSLVSLFQTTIPNQWNIFGYYPSSFAAAAAAAASLQLCLTLCDPIDGSPPGSPIPGILQARTLEWVAISFSNAWKWKAKVKSLSRVRLLVTPWTSAYQAPLSMGFSRQEYWSGVPLHSLKRYIF